MIKVMIADDHPIIRNRIRQILSDESDMSVSCEASTGQEVLDLTCTGEMDVLVLDFHLTDMNALELLPKLRARYPHLPILILSAMSEGMYAKKLISLGAAGFVGKETATEDLARMIREILPGH